METNENLTASQRNIIRSINANLAELTDRVLDDEGTYHSTCVHIIEICILAMQFPEVQVPSQYATYIFNAGQEALRLSSERLLRGSGLPAPSNLYYRTSTSPEYVIAESSAMEQDEIDGLGYYAVRRARLRANVNTVYTHLSSADDWKPCMDRATRVLKMAGRSLKTSRIQIPDDEMDNEEWAWRAELLDYVSHVLIFLAQSLAHECELQPPQRVTIWGQAV